MTGHRYRALMLSGVLVVCLAGFLLAQGASQDQADEQAGAQTNSTPNTGAPNSAPNGGQKLLVIDGKELPGATMLVDGRYYVSLDSVAEATNGSLTIEPNRIILITRGGAAPPAPPAAAVLAEAAPVEGMTRDFARQALSALGYMREWKAAMATVVSIGIQAVGTWPDDYRNRAQEALAQAQVAAMSNEDRETVGLLQNEEANLANWANQVVSARQSLNAEQNVNPNTLANDPNYQKISRCAEFLNGVVGAGVFADDPSCH